MQVSKSAYYSWLSKQGMLVSEGTLLLYRRIKALFTQSRCSLGSREMCKKLGKEGFKVGRYRVRKVMAKLGLKVTQRVAYKVTTKRKHSDSVAPNLVNQQFNPLCEKVVEIKCGQVTSLI